MTAPIDEKRLAAIEARANAATPGPWEPEHRGVVGNDVFIAEDCVTAGWDAYRANQAFIAHARTDVPALVAEVRRLTAALDAARREGAEGMREACAERVRYLRGDLGAVAILRGESPSTPATEALSTAERLIGRLAVDDVIGDGVTRALPLDAPGAA